MLSDKFIIPQGKVYMCGHSLGPSFKSSSEAVNNALHDFASYGVSSWNKSSWIDLPYRLGTKIAKLIGAKTNEVVVCDSTVVNLFKALNAAMKLQKKRKVILTTDDNFPADLYVAQGIGEVKLVKANEIIEHLNETVAVLMLTHVNYRDASVLDMQIINAYAHKFGILTLWDLSHSVGIVPLDLESSDTDFAVGCTYKYLSGGPGSPAFIYVKSKHHMQMESPIQGWMGHDNPFAFEPTYVASGIRKFMAGTPSILNMKCLEGALAHFNVELIKKAYNQVNHYSKLLIDALKNLNIEVCTPLNRGGHVAFIHQYGYSFSRALIEAGFTVDYRAPNLVRLCVNPLYISLKDIKACINQIQLIEGNALFLKPEYNTMQKVT